MDERKELIGLTLEEARRLYGGVIRPIYIDNVRQPLLRDVRPQRLNVHLQNGKIVRTAGFY